MNVNWLANEVVNYKNEKPALRRSAGNGCFSNTGHGNNNTRRCISQQPGTCHSRSIHDYHVTYATARTASNLTPLLPVVGWWRRAPVETSSSAAAAAAISRRRSAVGHQRVFVAGQIRVIPASPHMDWLPQRTRLQRLQAAETAALGRRQHSTTERALPAACRRAADTGATLSVSTSQSQSVASRCQSDANVISRTMRAQTTTTAGRTCRSVRRSGQVVPSTN